MATITVKKALIGKEDISYGNGTFSRATSTGGTQNITKLPSGVEVFNVKDYGAVGDGTTDDSTAIQAAIDAAEVSGGTVYFPASTYLVSTSLTVTRNVILRGEAVPGADPTKPTTGTILLRGANVIMFNMTSTNRSTDRYGHNAFKGLYFKDGADIGSASMIFGKYCDSVVFEDCLFSTPSTNTNNGHMVDAEESWDWRFRNCIWKHCGDSTASKAAVNIYNGATSNQNSNGWQFHSCRWQEPYWACVKFDSTGAGSRVNRHEFVQCKFEDASLAVSGGTFIQGEASHIKFVACDFANSNSVFVDIGASSFAWKFLGCSFENTEDVVAVTLSGDHCAFIGNQFKDVGTGTEHVTLASGADDNVFLGNQVNDATPLVGGTIGATVRLYANPGYMTEYSAQAQITSGNTTVVVTHGLDYTPSNHHISVTPHSSLGSAATFWVSTITSTQFTINVNADPTATVTFGWQAIRVRG